MKPMNPDRNCATRLAAIGGGLLLGLASAAAQPPAPAAPAQADTACVQPADMSAAHLYGLWQLRLAPLEPADAPPQSQGAVLFERHPEYPGSVRGRLQRSTPGNDVRAQLSGDVINGTFNLDESADGVTMSAVWEGAPSACSREIRGLRRPAEGRGDSEPAMRFHLTRTPGWR